MVHTAAFDLRRHHGFRNPPIPPPVPFPGAWETPAVSPRHYSARRSFNFRRPPYHWRRGPPMEPPRDPNFHHECPNLDYRYSGSVPPHHLQHYTNFEASQESIGHDRGVMLGGRQSVYPAFHEDIEEQDHQRSQPTLNREDEDNSIIEGTECENAPGAGSTDSEDPDLLGLSILNALEGVAAGGGEWTGGSGQSPVSTGRGGAKHETERNIWPGFQQEAKFDGQGVHEAKFEDHPAEAASPEDEEEAVELVMSPEWAEHLRNSPSVQRYLQRVASKKGPKWKDAGGGRGKGRGNDANRRGKQSGTPSNNASARKKGGKKAEKEKKEKEPAAMKTAGEAAEDEVSVAQREMELQLAKIKAHALLYAHQQQHRQLEDIMEES